MIEVKAWVSPNTFHCTVSRFNKRQGLSDMPVIGSNAKIAKRYNISADDEHMLGLVPECHDLFQVLHHAYTSGTDSCFYLISSQSVLIYIMHIQFQSDLLESYGAVLDWLYSKTLQQFYDPSDVVPEMLQ